MPRKGAKKQKSKSPPARGPKSRGRVTKDRVASPEPSQSPRRPNVTTRAMKKSAAMTNSQTGADPPPASSAQPMALDEPRFSTSLAPLNESRASRPAAASKKPRATTRAIVSKKPRAATRTVVSKQSRTTKRSVVSKQHRASTPPITSPESTQRVDVAETDFPTSPELSPTEGQNIEPRLEPNVAEKPPLNWEASFTRDQRRRWKTHLLRPQYYLDLPGEWDLLDVAIRNFATRFFPIGFTLKSFDESALAKLTAMCPKAAQYLTDSGANGSRDLFAAWIWRILYDNLFSPDCEDKWAGEGWAAFAKLQRSLRGGLTDFDTPYTSGYYHIMNGAFRRLYMLHGPHVDQARLVSLIEKEINPLTRLGPEISIADLDTDDSNPPGPREDLPRLVQKAIDIDMSIQGSQVKIVLDMADPKTGLVAGFPFERGLMRPCPVLSPHKHNKGRPVDYIYRPSLRSYGEFEKSLYGQGPSGSEWWKELKDINVCTGVSKMEVMVDGLPGPEEESDGNVSTGSSAPECESIWWYNMRQKLKREGKIPW